MQDTVGTNAMNFVHPDDLEIAAVSMTTVNAIGGDEFAVLIEHFREKSDAEDIVRRILAVLSTPIDVGGRGAGTNASIGIAYGRAGDTADDLLRNADLAM